jgi:hypothetical protein
MEIVDYTEKSFVLCGDTKIHKNILMEMGGKWNPNLKVGAGWIFSNKKKDCVLEWINTIEKTPQVNSNSNSFSLSQSILPPTRIESSFIKKVDISEEIISEFSDELSKSDCIKTYHFLHDDDKVTLYRKLFFNFLVSRSKDMTYEEYKSLDIEKIIEYCIIKHFKSQSNDML